MRSVLVGVGLAVVISGAGVPAFAQQGTSEITGRALDEQGAALPGVAIVVTNEDSGQFREATTSAEGVYHLAQMMPGRYSHRRQARRVPHLRAHGAGGRRGHHPDHRISPCRSARSRNR